MEQDRPVAYGLRGGLSVAKAELITKTVNALPGDTADLEARLVRAGRVLDYARLKMKCRTDGARHDAAHLEGRERRQAAARYLELTEDASGVTQISGALDPVSAAFVRTYMDAQVKAAFQAKREDPSESRTATQIRADALVALAVHGLDCDARGAGVKATVILRINQEDLTEQVGVGTCDALGTPISLTALRQMAVDAAVLPMVVNGRSQVLDMGREQRLFTWAQRMAIAERDGGCAKCHAPISHCITHHIDWWTNGGLTNLNNGVLLCVRCHTQLHRDRWEIEIDKDNRVWFTPSPQIDRDRRRLLGGLAALTVP
jgi:5-methylcytosine-specific restriction protein A